MHANKKLTPEHVEQIIQGVRNGESYAQLARDYKVSQTRIYQLAKQHQVHVPKRPRRTAGAVAG